MEENEIAFDFGDAEEPAPTLRQRAPRVSPAMSIVVLLLVLGAAVLLWAAFYYPFIDSAFELTLPSWIPDWNGLHEKIENWVVRKGGIIVGSQYLLDIILRLFKNDEIVLGIMVSCFSVVFPGLKILMTMLVLLMRSAQWSAARATTMHWLKSLARWSMGDVFVVALVVVLFKAKGFNYEFTPDIGVYFYAASTIVASIAVSILQLMERRQRG